MGDLFHGMMIWTYVYMRRIMKDSKRFVWNNYLKIYFYKTKLLTLIPKWEKEC